MLPNQLSAASFAGYPPEARQLAVKRLALLQRLPLAFLPLLLRELIVYDWKFPAERGDFVRQFTYLGSLADGPFQAAMSAFAQLKLGRELEQTDWVNAPAIFSEQLSAHLWTTHQIDSFSAAAVEYMRKVTASAPEPGLPVHRLGMAAIGQGAAPNDDYRLFRKLRPQGVYFTQVKPAGGVQVLLDAAAARARAHPVSYGHWYIDGGAGLGVPERVTRVSYGALAAPRATIQSRMQKTYEAAVFDPEAFRTTLAQMKPEEAGFRSGEDQVLTRFQLSLLTEGSGTQVFATTFVQWAAREALRRAQPLTLLVRFAPRQRDRQMNELLAEHQRQPDLDPHGSLIDADMGAYYTWLNQQRLSGDDKSAFLAWFENHGEAVAIGPGMERGQRSDTPIELASLVARVA
ncbi:MAG: hypothetical protein P4L56_15895 [Candidatus Sulfopaludibacter sp.]|nr:hypothetical protein [Candidatus Sulfopaludibacter sp.]